MQVQVSVVMPVYNMENFVEDAVKSILQQTFVDFEFIIIDDASNDATVEVLNKYKDSRIIQYINDCNRGNYYSRNKGIQLAKGKYIAMMDADDIAMIDRLEKQVTYLEENHDVLAVGTDCIFLANNNQKNVVCSYSEIMIALLDYNCFVHSSLLVRSDVLRQLNGYDEYYYYSADYDLACRLVQLGKVENLASPLMKYRWHSSQISVLNAVKQKLYADEIRNKYRLSFINRYKKKNQSKVEVADISYPDIGRLISLYTYASYTDNSDYERQADSLLDNIFMNISMEIPVCLENGLIGIGCGLIYLIRNYFVEGDEVEVLSEIDGCLINKLLFSFDPKDIDWYGFLYYFRLRISYNYPADWKIYEITLCQHAVYLLDCLMRSIQTSVNWDKRIIGELELFHQMKICPTKTSQILSVLTSIDNNQLSFIIPIRIDSIERERNLDFVLELLNEIENVDISILEGDIKPLYRLKKKYCNVTYRFTEDTNPIFYRTKYLNQLLREVQGCIVGIWDADAITSKEQILDAVNYIRSGRAIMSFPYDGRFIMLSPMYSDKLIKSGLNRGLSKKVVNRYLAHGPHSVGGAFFVNKKIYLESGGENEYFYGWGPEDAERVKRMEILGYPVYRAKGPLFHLHHPRKENSWYGNDQIEYKNRCEFLKISSMSKDELQKYIVTWNWKPLK